MRLRLRVFVVWSSLSHRIASHRSPRLTSPFPLRQAPLLLLLLVPRPPHSSAPTPAHPIHMSARVQSPCSVTSRPATPLIRLARRRTDALERKATNAVTTITTKTKINDQENRNRWKIRAEHRTAGMAIAIDKLFFLHLFFFCVFRFRSVSSLAALFNSASMIKKFGEL